MSELQMIAQIFTIIQILIITWKDQVQNSAWKNTVF